MIAGSPGAVPRQVYEHCALVGRPPNAHSTCGSGRGQVSAPALPGGSAHSSFHGHPTPFLVQIHFVPIPGDSVDRLIAEGEIYWCAGGLMVVSRACCRSLLVVQCTLDVLQLACCQAGMHVVHSPSQPCRSRQPSAAPWSAAMHLEHHAPALAPPLLLTPPRSTSWYSHTSFAWTAAWTR